MLLLCSTVTFWRCAHYCTSNIIFGNTCCFSCASLQMLSLKSFVNCLVFFYIYCFIGMMSLITHALSSTSLMMCTFQQYNATDRLCRTSLVPCRPFHTLDSFHTRQQSHTAVRLVTDSRMETSTLPSLALELDTGTGTPL